MTRSTDRLAIWARRSFDVLLVVLIVVCLLTVVLARVVPLTGRSTFVVAGGSMAPAISVGSAVVVEPVAAADLRVGDVVSLRSGPQRAIFTHRITRVAQRDGATWIETQGDANATADPSLSPASAVIGRVTRRPAGRRLRDRAAVLAERRDLRHLARPGALPRRRDARRFTSRPADDRHAGSPPDAVVGRDRLRLSPTIR